MNILYFFGNGLDKAQGMKTSYPEFYNFLNKNSENCSPLLRKMMQSIQNNSELWSDMELAFGNFTSSIKNADDFESLYYELNDYLQLYLKNEDELFVPSNDLKNKFINDFLYYDSYLGDLDKVRFKQFISSFSEPWNIYIITLNYTNTLEKLLEPLGHEGQRDFGGNRRLHQLIHVHGLLDDSIIIGVDNESQITKDSFRVDDDIKDIIVKNQSNITMKYTRSFVCEDLIKKANLIIFFGVSLGETDNRWWKLIGEQFKNRNDLSIILYLYMQKPISTTRKQLTGQIERKKTNEIMKKMGVAKNDWPADTKDRLYFVVNSDAFKL